MRNQSAKSKILTTVDWLGLPGLAGLCWLCWAVLWRAVVGCGGLCWAGSAGPCCAGLAVLGCAVACCVGPCYAVRAGFIALQLFHRFVTIIKIRTSNMFLQSQSDIKAKTNSTPKFRQQSIQMRTLTAIKSNSTQAITQ